MKFNKRCLTAFSDENPFMAMGTKSKLFDTSFSLTSELFLYDYSAGVQYPALQTDNKFYRLRWCEGGDRGILATGNEEGRVTLYTPAPEKNISFEMVSSCAALEGDVLGLDFNPSKNVIAAGSSNGKIIFWNLNKIDSQYTSDIPLTSNITCLSWNKKVSRILCVGTDDGKILILDIRAKNVAMTLGGEEMTSVMDVMWHPSGSTSILAATNQKKVQCFNLSSDSTFQIGSHENGLISLSVVDCSHVAAASKEQVDIIDVSENRVVESIPVDGIFEASFSRKDPLMALSYRSGSTEVVPRTTERMLPSNSGCIVEDKVVGSDVYRIEDENMREVEEDRLMKKIKEVLYKDGVYELRRRGLGEMLLEEEMNKGNECLEENGLDKKVGELSMKMRFDLKDPLTLALIRGDLDKAYEESIKGSRTIPFSLFLALAKGKDALPMESDDVLILLSVSQLTSTFGEILHKVSKDQWMVLVSLVSLSSLSDTEFISNALRIAEELHDRDKLIVYAMTNRLEEYFRLKTSMYTMPTDVYGVRDFFQSYKSVMIDLESMNGCYKDPAISEYFWYAIAHGERPTKIKYDDMGININLGKTSFPVKMGQKDVPVGKGVHEKMGRISPLLEAQTPSRVASDDVGMARGGFYDRAKGPMIPGHKDGGIGQEARRTQHAFSPATRGSQLFPKPGSPTQDATPGPRSETVSPAYKGIPQPPALSHTLSPQYVAAPQGPPPKPYIPKPGMTPQGTAASTYGSAPAGLSMTYSSASSVSSYPPMPSPPSSMSQSMSTPSTYGSTPRSGPPGPYISRPGLTPQSAPGYSGSPPKGHAPMPQPPRTQTTAGPATYSQGMQDDRMASMNKQEQQSHNLNTDEILDVFEAIIRDLTEKASSRANLIIRNKLKEVTKRLAIYNSVSRESFSSVVLDGIDRINKEIKRDGDYEEMKNKVRETVVKCSETGENRADLWMPSIYTLLQIVYH